MEFIYSSKAERDLRDLPGNIQKRIASKMRFYEKQENPLKHDKKLLHFEMGEYRFRIGDYRVVFDSEGDKIYILKICKRDNVYR